MSYKAVPCMCGDKICKHWHVSAVADRQGVSFTQQEAEAVANLLNIMMKQEQEGWHCRAPTNGGGLPICTTQCEVCKSMEEEGPGS